MTDHLLAAAVDHLAAANWMFSVVNAAEDSDQPDAPEPVPRPDGKPYGSSGQDPDQDQDPDPGAPRVPAQSDAVSPEALVRFFG
ncbi:hypothetical protein ACIGFK_38230 [Streptomyces sp. NPDC085524]|uniref:hypothetical protein n=1 Tax=unclassified Streptomyces TaxID=2593676 RepID=UPI0035D9A1FD